MDWVVLIVAIFGLFSLVGGIIGFAKAASTISLVTGSISGIILLICAWGISGAHQWASIVAFIMAILLGGRFLGTWLRTKRIMPDLLMILLSVATLIAVALKLL